ncbi:MAG: MmgE/PrpD family protein [Proteobacteria bacterium]|nr:MmgE/PrpD family protein [Pseudomonadota bacterium]
MPEHPTRYIAERVAETRIGDAPPEAVRIAKDLILDTVACMLAGAIEPGTHIVKEFARRSGAGQATLVGFPDRVPAFQAALVNGTSAAILDYDDTSWRSIGHPSGCVLPAVLALGEERAAGGRKVLEAYMVGYEVIGKIARGLVPALYRRGRHTTGALGIFGAAAACGKLLGLDAEGIARAFGIAASCSGALRAALGSMTKSLHSGHAAANGLMAARLAADGFTAPADVLEGTHGFAATSLPEEEYDLDAIGQGWAAPWEFLAPSVGPGINLVPSGTTGFCAAECAVEIAKRHDLDPAAVARIQWATTPFARDVARFGVPETRHEAFYSIGWSIAIALLDRRFGVGIGQFGEERLRDPATRALCARVGVSVHADLATVTDPSLSVAGELVVTLEDGRQLRCMRRHPRAYPGGEPWTEEQLLEKYRDAAARALDRGRTDASLGCLRAFETLADVRDLTAKLRPAAP